LPLFASAKQLSNLGRVVLSESLCTTMSYELFVTSSIFNYKICIMCFEIVRSMTA
jgi:hypothetical protein